MDYIEEKDRGVEGDTRILELELMRVVQKIRVPFWYRHIFYNPNGSIILKITI